MERQERQEKTVEKQKRTRKLLGKPKRVEPGKQAELAEDVAREVAREETEPIARGKQGRSVEQVEEAEPTGESWSSSAG